MNDWDTLAEINKVMDAYEAGRLTMAKAMDRIAWAIGRNRGWHRTNAA